MTIVGRSTASGRLWQSLDGARRHERFGQVILPAVHSRAWLAWCHAELGMFAEGSALGEEGLRIAEAVAHPASLMCASWGIGLLSLRQGDLPRALPRLERAVGICQDADLPFYFPWMAAALGAAYTLGGRVADAVPLLTQAMEQSTARETRGLSGALSVSPWGRRICWPAAWRRRTPSPSARWRSPVSTRNAATRRMPCASSARLRRGASLQRSSRPKPHYRQALALAEELGMRPLQAHCHRGLGTLYATIGQQEQARAELSAAIVLYRAMDMTFWLPQTEAALAQVEGQ